MKSDVERRGNVYGGVYVWGFEPENTNDLHDGKTNTATARHHIDFHNEGDTSLSYRWEIEFEVLGTEAHEVLQTKRSSGSGTIDAGEREQIAKSLSFNVAQWRPGTIGLRGRTRLYIDGETWDTGKETTHPLHLSAGH